MTRSQVRRVAVIGAGISGVVSAGHLLEAGLEVTVFERSDKPGGIWLYDDRPAPEPSYKALKPLESEAVFEKMEPNPILAHAPPGPCYAGLNNNVSTPLMRVKLNAWPESTPDFVNHSIIQDYIQDTSVKTGVHDITIYGARVKGLSKKDGLWRATWSTLENGKEEERISNFDAVIVASGHYHTHKLPDTPGLAEAKARWPEQIYHSKRYRKPEGFENKNVLLVGGAVSAIDIAKEISPQANKIYQSTRGGEFDIAASILPGNGVRVSEGTRYEIVDTPKDGKLPLKVHLRSGQELCGLDEIIICTGYQFSLPFLPHHHDDHVSPEDADDRILVTDGSQAHNLHKDIFYIPDPSLAFVGIPFYTATFTLFEFQAITVANVFAGVVPLPAQKAMRTEYIEKVRTKGYGKRFHSLKNVEEGYVIDLMNWVNAYRTEKGLGEIEGHTRQWHEARGAMVERVKALFEGAKRDSGIGAPELPPCS